MPYLLLEDGSRLTLEDGSGSLLLEGVAVESGRIDPDGPSVRRRVWFPDRSVRRRVEPAGNTVRRRVDEEG